MTHSLRLQFISTILPLIFLLFQSLGLAAYFPPLLRYRFLLPLFFIDVFDDFLRICLAVCSVFYSIHDCLLGHPMEPNRPRVRSLSAMLRIEEDGIQKFAYVQIFHLPLILHLFHQSFSIFICKWNILLSAGCLTMNTARK